MTPSYAQISSVLASMPQAVFIKDAHSRILMMNAACETLWGVRFKDVVGTDCSGCMLPEELSAYQARDRRAFDTGEVVVEEEPCSPTGFNETRWLLTYKRAVYDAEGKPYLLIGSCTDITERKRKETELANALQQTREISGHQLTTLEHHRRRLALKTQDDLAQNLMALKLDIAMLYARTGERQPLLHGRAAQALETLNASIGAVREIINELHPATLELGLSAAIEWQLQQTARRRGLQYQLLVSNDSAALSQQQTSALFHIVQTGLNYVSDAARSLQVQLDLQAGRLVITLRSDRPDNAPDADGIQALHAIQERLTILGGSLHIAPRSLQIIVPSAI